MTVEEMIEIFENHKGGSRWELTDLDGFIRLKELGWQRLGSVVNEVQSKCDLISSAEHDEIWLDVDLEWLANVAKKEDIEYLVDCGIYYDESLEGLHLFV